MCPILSAAASVRAHLLAWLLPCLLTAACVAVPVPVARDVIEGRQYTDAQLDFVEPGATTRSDVSAALGEPTIWLPDQRIMVYGLRRTGPLGMLIFLPGNVAYVEREEREAVFVATDARGAVARRGRAPIDVRETWLTAALEWARTQGLDVRAPGDRFTEETPAPGESVIHVYRPRDYQHYLPLVPPAEGLLFGAAKFVDVRLDGRLVAQLQRGTYASIHAPPGAHVITVNPDTDDVGNASLHRTASIRVDAARGGTVFVDVGVRAGFGVIEPVLVLRDRSEALEAIAELRQCW